MRKFYACITAKAIALVFVFLTVVFSAQASPPTITSFSPTSGIIGTTVTITGTGFSATPTDNIVYFGAVKAMVSASTITNVTITIPAGAGSVVPVSVTVGGLTAYSIASATPKFNLTNTPNLTPNFAISTYSTGESPFSVAIGDFNGDDNPDMAITNYDSYTVSIFLGNGTGSFSDKTDFAVGIRPTAVAVGDFNSDGKQDLVTANSYSNSISVILGDGAGDFGAKTDFTVGTEPASVAIGDFNGDGKADLVVANDNSSRISILLGDGAGSFGTKTDYLLGLNPRSIAIGDFNGDRIADLVDINEGSNKVSILLGNGDGSFKVISSISIVNPYSVAIGDFNGDAKADLVVTTGGSNNASILLGDGLGGFGTKTDFSVGTSPVSVVAGDFNGDGKLDLATANYYSSNVSVLLGNGLGGFGTRTDFWVGTWPESIAIGDFNRDGKADLVAPNFHSNTVSILLYTVLSLTTETVTDITPSGATFHGTITNLGDSNPTSYGFCWNTSGVPTTADDKIDKGAVSTTGAFTSAITGLSPSKTYHVRTFATDPSGTVYGNEIIFTTLPPISIISFSPTKGLIGTSVTITGTGFSATPTDNIVYFGAVKAMVSASTITSVTVTVPAGAGSVVPVSVTVGGLTAYSTTNKTPTFNLTNTPSLTPDYAINTYSTGTKPYSVAIGDFNGDGNPDLAIANISSLDISVLLGNGKGSFGAKTNYYVGSSSSVAIGDFNGDGNSDLIVISKDNDQRTIWLGDGKGSFVAIFDYLLGYYGASVATGDFNGDGKTDLVSTNNNYQDIRI